MTRLPFSHVPRTEQEYQDLLELLAVNDNDIVTGIEWPHNVLRLGRPPLRQATFLQQPPPQHIETTATSISSGGNVDRTAVPVSQSLLGTALVGNTTVTKLLLGVWDLFRYELGDAQDEDRFMHFFAPLLVYFRTITALHSLL
jgi:hypothetical protein